MKILRFVTMGLLLAYMSFTYAEPVNINTSSASEIAVAMKGVGEKRANAVIAYRNEHGNFSSIDDLNQIKGIGQKTIDKNRDNITVGTHGSAVSVGK